MKRIANFKQRKDMENQLNNIGFDYWHLPSSDGSTYWNDTVGYEFKLEEIDKIEDSANEIHQMCLDFVDEEIKKGDYRGYNFNSLQKELIEQSWNRKDLHLYGRFDFGYDGKNLKLFEYNADTPTSLLESAVAQWNWIEQIEGLKNRDQFNFIHEALEERFKFLKEKTGCKHFHFVGMEEAGREDWGNIDYLTDLAYSQGFNVHQLATESIGVKKDHDYFVDVNDENMELVFKLYPLEWMTTSDFAKYLKNSKTKFVEPFWKMLLSNKVLMAKLWEKHEGHDLLLPTYLNSYKIKNKEGNMWVKKPILGREGANISYLDRNNGLEFQGKGSEFSPVYDADGFVFQQKFNMPNYDGFYPMLGVWVVGDKACGMGMREDFTAITGNDSHFVPHYFIE